MPTIVATKNRRTLVAAGTSVAAAGTVSAIWGDGTVGVAGCALPSAPDICTITGKITNGATGPTASCAATIEISGDGSTNWEQVAVFVTNTTANAVFPINQDLPKAARFARITFTGNTVQAVTVEAFGEEITNYVGS